MVWINICSAHGVRHTDCPRCDLGSEVPQWKLNIDHMLFNTNYVEWFKMHNGGQEPTPEQIERHANGGKEKKLPALWRKLRDR